MSAKHTPGPWTTDGSNITASGSNIAIVKGPWTVGASDVALDARKQEHARDEANARLIAAAPELLAALESVVSDLAWGTTGRWKGEGVAPLRAAIAKAKA